MKNEQKKCVYDKKLPCYWEAGYFTCMKCYRYVIEFAKLFADGLESIVIYPSGTYNVKYKGKKYEGTIEEVFTKWNEEQVKYWSKRI